jgi:hydroxypyruvate reductase
MRPDILYTGGYPEPLEVKLAAEFTVHPMWTAAGGLADLSAVADRIRVATGAGWKPFTREHMERLPNLEGICRFGVGYETIDVTAARELGIIVTNTAGCTSDSVADLAIGLLLAVTRHIAAGDRFVRAGRWMSAGYPLVSGLGGKRLGILGLGGIGHEVARRANGFKLEIAYCGRTRQDTPYTYYEEPAALAAAVDYLVVAAPATPATHHIIDERVLRALGKDGVLVNVARGSLVDEVALLTALQTGVIAGAGLDVFENEPYVPEAFFALDNVVMTPHRAGGDWQTWWRCFDLACANVRAILAGEPPLTPVP